MSALPGRCSQKTTRSAKGHKVSAEETVLVLAPLWRDAEVICRALEAGGFSCHPCRDMQDLRARLASGAGALLLAEEALGDESRALLLQTLQSQPPWSDLPVTLLLSPGQQPLQTPLRKGHILSGHNVTILQRPVSSTTLLSVMNAALRARRRQYELREQLRRREQRTELLEQRVQVRTRRLQELSDRYLASRDLFMTLFQANPLPIAITRLEDGVFLDVNEAFLRYFGVRRDEIVQRAITEMDDWFPIRERLKVLARLRNAGAVRNLETVTTPPSGEPKTVLISAELVTLEGVEAALVDFVDITERKRAEEKIRELATELTRAEHAERHRISQILHDDLQQQLYGLQMQLSFVREDASERIVRELEALEPTVQSAIATVRNLSVDLSPPILHNEGLVEGIGWIANRMREQYRLQVDVQAEGSFPVPDDAQRVLLFQILRELLFNAVKHAGVQRVGVRLKEEGANVRIDVVDEGSGFDPQQVLQEDSGVGQGLSSARHRLQLMGGRLEIYSVPGEGTRATIFTPANP